MATDPRNTQTYKAFSRRTVVLSLGTLGLFGGLLGRLWQLQVVEAEKYRVQAEDNRINQHWVAPLRGRILDRFGREVASNRENYRVLMVPEEAGEVEETLARVAALIGLSEGEVRQVLREIGRRPSHARLTVAENLDWSAFAQINFKQPDLPGIEPDVGDTRHYPFDKTLAHVVGYVGAVSEDDLTSDDPLLTLPGFKIGKNGVERTLDERLRGTAGRSHVEVNANGKIIRELKREEGQPGEDAVLTLDLDLQQYAHERLKGESGSAVLLDVTNGDVLALASAPSFDPNDFNVGISSAQWNALINNKYKPLLNKTVAATYPPGSTFKMLVGLLALEKGLVGPDDTFFCNGHFRFGGHDFHCWKRGGHGHMDLKHAIKRSCDVYFYELAKQLDVDEIAEVARDFGLGQVLDFELKNQKEGIIPTKGWKYSTLGEPWYRGETVNTVIGQGYVTSTPLQLAVMTARLVNGGRSVLPHLIRSIGPDPYRAPPEVTDMPYSARNLGLIIEAMNSVMEAGGTAWRSRITDEGLSMGGKTGTSQIRRITPEERAAGVIKNEDLPWHRRDHALFVGYGPIEAPRYAVSVVVDHGGSGSKAAAPIASDILRRAMIRDPARRPAIGPQVPEGALEAARGATTDRRADGSVNGGAGDADPAGQG